MSEPRTAVHRRRARQGAQRLVAMLALALGACAPALHDPAQARPSPASYYWTTERPTQEIPLRFSDAHAELYNPIERTRRVIPKKTARAFSRAELKSWSAKGDPVASYILGAQAYGDFEAQAIHNEQRQRRLPSALPYFERAAAATNACPGLSDPAAREFVGCGRGLAEAQYILSACHRYPIAPCAPDPQLSARLCADSRDQGFAPAARLCPKP